jgi:cytochrome c peroxidase
MGCTTTRKEEDSREIVKAYLMANIDSLERYSATLAEAVKEKQYDEVTPLFVRLRKIYKHTEGLTEFYFPGISKAINGSALDKAEEGDDKVIEATGFQVIEEYIFPLVDTSASETLLTECRSFRHRSYGLGSLRRARTLRMPISSRLHAWRCCVL